MRDEDEIRLQGHDALVSAERDVALLEGHTLLAGGGDTEPVIKVLQPKPRGMRLLSILKGHNHAITQLAADTAGRYHFSASAGDHTVIVWDALTFTPVQVFKDVDVGGMALAPDSLFISSFKPPYLKRWSVSTQSTVSLSSDVATMAREEAQVAFNAPKSLGTALLASIYPNYDKAASHEIDEKRELHSLKMASSKDSKRVKKGSGRLPAPMESPATSIHLSASQRHVRQQHAEVWARLLHEFSTTRIVASRQQPWCKRKLIVGYDGATRPGAAVAVNSGGGAMGGDDLEISLAAPSAQIDENERAQVVIRWMSQYYRQEATPDFQMNPALALHTEGKSDKALGSRRLVAKLGGIVTMSRGGKDTSKAFSRASADDVDNYDYTNTKYQDNVPISGKRLKETPRARARRQQEALRMQEKGREALHSIDGPASCFRYRPLGRE